LGAFALAIPYIMWKLYDRYHPTTVFANFRSSNEFPHIYDEGYFSKLAAD
jgi:hypothetical protein